MYLCITERFLCCQQRFVIFLNISGDMVWAFDSGSPEAQYQRRYVGHYVDNIRNGKGKMTYPNGDKYTGKDFKYCIPCRRKEIFKCVSNIITQFNSFNLSLVIQGDWVDGNRSGKGLYLYSETGNRYKGIAGICIFIEHFEI